MKPSPLKRFFESGWITLPNILSILLSLRYRVI